MAPESIQQSKTTIRHGTGFMVVRPPTPSVVPLKNVPIPPTIHRAYVRANGLAAQSSSSSSAAAETAGSAAVTTVNLNINVNVNVLMEGHVFVPGQTIKEIATQPALEAATQAGKIEAPKRKKSKKVKVKPIEPAQSSQRPLYSGPPIKTLNSSLGVPTRRPPAEASKPSPLSQFVETASPESSEDESSEEEEEDNDEDDQDLENPPNQNTPEEPPQAAPLPLDLVPPKDTNPYPNLRDSLIVAIVRPYKEITPDGTMLMRSRSQNNRSRLTRKYSASTATTGSRTATPNSIARPTQTEKQLNSNPPSSLTSTGIRRANTVHSQSPIEAPREKSERHAVGSVAPVAFHIPFQMPNAGSHARAGLTKAPPLNDKRPKLSVSAAAVASSSSCSSESSCTESNSSSPTSPLSPESPLSPLDKMLGYPEMQSQPPLKAPVDAQLGSPFAPTQYHAMSSSQPSYKPNNWRRPSAPESRTQIKPLIRGQQNTENTGYPPALAKTTTGVVNVVPSVGGSASRQTAIPNSAPQMGLHPHECRTQGLLTQESSLNIPTKQNYSQQPKQESSPYKSFSLSRKLSFTEESYDAHRLPSFTSSSAKTRPSLQQTSSLHQRPTASTKVESLKEQLEYAAEATPRTAVGPPCVADVTQDKTQESRAKKDIHQIAYPSLTKEPVDGRKQSPTPLDLAPPQFLASSLYSLAPNNDTHPKPACASKEAGKDAADPQHEKENTRPAAKELSSLPLLAPKTTTVTPGSVGSAGPRLDVHRILQQQLGGSLPVFNNKHTSIVRSSALYDYELELYDDYIHSSGGSEASTPRASSVQSWGDRTSNEISVDPIKV